MLTSRFLRFRKFSSKGNFDKFFALPVPREQVPLLPAGTVGDQPMGHPSSIEIRLAEFASQLEAAKFDFNAKIKDLKIEIAALETRLTAQGAAIAALEVRIRVLENQPLILQIFETIKFSEKLIVEELLPSEAYVLPENLRTFAYLKSLIQKDTNGKRKSAKTKMPNSLEDFFSDPLVKEIYIFMDSNEYKSLTKYRNNIAHTHITEIKRLRSVAETLNQLIPFMPEREASVIEAINKSHPIIMRMFMKANEFS